jgi:hypothetical protein
MVATKEDILPRAETWKYTLHSFPITEEEMVMGESSCKKDKSPENAEEKARLRKRMEGVVEEAMNMEDGSRKAFYLFGFGHSSIPVEFRYLDKEQAEAIFDTLAALNQREKVTIENMMPIGVGREMIGLAKVKRLDGVLASIQKVAEGFSKVMPGATNEIYPEQGCFVQAWNSLATMWPYANSMFGIRPNAYQKKLVLDPCVGPEIDGMSLKNLLIGGEHFDMSYRRDGEWDVILVERPSEDWTIELAEGVENIRLVVE